MVWPLAMELTYLFAHLLTALWHWRCVQRKPLILRLYFDGALLPPAEAATSHSSPARGIGHSMTPPPRAPILISSIKEILFCEFDNKLSCVLTFQIFDGSAVPQRMVDGWNAFFCDNLDDLVSNLKKIFDYFCFHLALYVLDPNANLRCSSVCAASTSLRAAAEHGVCGRAVVGAPALLHRRIWLQGACHQHPPKKTPHHLWKTVDQQMHCHRRWSDHLPPVIFLRLLHSLTCSFFFFFSFRSFWFKS